MANRPADPFSTDDARPEAEPFAVGYNRSSGEAIVYGGVFMAVACTALAALFKMPILNILAIVPFGVGLWHLPMIEKQVPQLGANKDGLFVERIGFLNWADIKAIGLSSTAVRTMELTTLEITLSRPLEEAIAKPQAFPFWKKLMIRNWQTRKLSDGDVLVCVQLHTLKANPSDVLQKLRAFRRF